VWVGQEKGVRCRLVKGASGLSSEESCVTRMTVQSKPLLNQPSVELKKGAKKKESKGKQTYLTYLSARNHDV